MPQKPYGAVKWSFTINVYHKPRPHATTSYNNPGLASQCSRSSSYTHTILNFTFWLAQYAQILIISLVEGSVCAEYICTSHLDSTILVPKWSSDSSSNLVPCWPAAYDTPELPTIKALAGLTCSKGELDSGFDKENGTLLAFPGL